MRKMGEKVADRSFGAATAMIVLFIIWLVTHIFPTLGDLVGRVLGKD